MLQEVSQARQLLGVTEAANMYLNQFALEWLNNSIQTLKSGQNGRSLADQLRSLQMLSCTVDLKDITLYKKTIHHDGDNAPRCAEWSIPGFSRISKTSVRLTSRAAEALSASLSLTRMACSPFGSWTWPYCNLSTVGLTNSTSACPPAPISTFDYKTEDTFLLSSV